MTIMNIREEIAMSDDQLLTAADLAAKTKLSLASVGRRFRAGDAPPSFYRGRCRFFEAGVAVDEWIARHRVGA
jgi:hypothetical protein